MNTEYDVIIMGTGYKECLLSGLLAMEKKRVLHMDKNAHYGLDNATFSLKDLYSHFGEPAGVPAQKKERLGAQGKYLVDICPKFVMAGGDMFAVLLKTSIPNYIQFSTIDRTFIYMNGRVEQVPTTPGAAMSSGLLGFWQKIALRRFFKAVASLPAGGADAQTPRQLMDASGLEPKTQALVYHVIGLFLEDSALDVPGGAPELLKRIRMYQHAMAVGKKSPFIYPYYGLSSLPEAFSRVSAVNNGVFMLQKTLERVLYREDKEEEGTEAEAGRVRGVVCDGEEAYAPVLVANHCFFPEDTEEAGTVARCLLILDEQPLAYKAKGLGSFSLIVLGKELNRKHDVYVTCVSAAQKVSEKGRYLVAISCIVEK